MSEKTDEKPASPGRGVNKPRDWGKAVCCAYLRLIGATQDEAALQAGAGVRTLRDWEVSTWWPDAVAEARGRWLKTGDELAMRGLVANMKKNEPGTCRWWGDRRLKELAPPTAKAEITGADGGPIVTIVKRFVGNGNSR